MIQIISCLSKQARGDCSQLTIIMGRGFSLPHSTWYANIELEHMQQKKVSLIQILSRSNYNKRSMPSGLTFPHNYQTSAKFSEIPATFIEHDQTSSCKKNSWPREHPKWCCHIHGILSWKEGNICNTILQKNKQESVKQ